MASVPVTEAPFPGVDAKAPPPFRVARLWVWEAQPAPGTAGVEGSPVCRWARPEDAPALARAMGLTPSLVCRRLEWCRAYLGLCGGEVVCYGWVSFAETPLGEVNAVFHPPPGEAYIWDCATLPAHRGRGLFTLLLRSVLADLALEGVPRAWMANRHSNTPARRAAARAGFQPVLSLLYLRLLCLQRWLPQPFPGAPSQSVAAALRVIRPLP